MEQPHFFIRVKPYLKVCLTIFLILFAGKFLLRDALPFFWFNKQTFGRFWNFKWSLIGHISCGITALVLGPFQFWNAFRNKYLTVHRWLGRIYLIAILLGTISATFLAWTSSIKINFSWAFALQVLALAWITTSSMAYISILRRRIFQHKEWMIRSYIVTFAFATFRWLSDLPIAIHLMNNFEERGPTMVWLSWTVPLLVTEIILSWKRK